MTTELNLLQQASGEIKRLRNQNQLMNARLSVFDDMMLLLKTEPNYRNGLMCSPDLVYEIDQHIETEKQRDKEKTTTDIPKQ